MENKGKYKVIAHILNVLTILLLIFFSIIFLKTVLGLISLNVMLNRKYEIQTDIVFIIAISNIFIMYVWGAKKIIYDLKPNWNDVDIQMLGRWIFRGKKPTDYLCFSRRD